MTSGKSTFLRPEHPLAAPTTASDRAAMGYPEHFTASRLPGLHAHTQAFAGMRAERLIALFEDAEAVLEDRVAAATQLGLIGDPRIDPLNPSMIDVPGGPATMGLRPEEVDRVMDECAGLMLERSWIEKETPAFEIMLEPYRIGRYPVTNLEYRMFLEETRYPELPTSWQFGRYPDHMANHPVFTVSSAGADAYARWLAERTGRAFRLPTEAEWEIAAAGREGREYPWGNRFEADRANTVECGLLTSTPVGAFPGGRAACGAEDMAGNVEEYVADTYAPYPGGPVIHDDLVTAVARDYRVARGGSFTRFRDLARCRRRHGRYPRVIYVMGFRLAEGARP